MLALRELYPLFAQAGVPNITLRPENCFFVGKSLHVCPSEGSFELGEFFAYFVQVKPVLV